MSTGELISTLSNLVFLLAIAIALAWALRSPMVRTWLQARRAQRHIQIVERVVLDRTHHLYLMQMGGTWLLVSTGDRCAPQLIWQGPAEPSQAERQLLPLRHEGHEAQERTEHR